MFRCDFCGDNVAANTPRQTLCSLREKHYSRRTTTLKNGKPVGRIVQRPLSFVDEDGKKKLYYPEDPGGHGREIDREYATCPACYKIHKDAFQ